MGARSQDIVSQMLTEWAHWIEKICVDGLGYDDETTLYKALFARADGGFGPRIPQGVFRLDTATREVERVHAVLQELINFGDPVIEERVRLTAMSYVFGIPAIAEQTGKSLQWVYQQQQRGQDIVRTMLRVADAR